MGAGGTINAATPCSYHRDGGPSADGRLNAGRTSGWTEK